MKDLKHMIYFEKLLEQADNELVEKAKAEGKLAIGYSCYYVPEVLTNLPGCFGSRLRAPGMESLDVATYYMTNKICSYTRSILEYAIIGSYAYLDALLSSETCQMMHRGHEHFEILGINSENPHFFMTMMDVPFNDGDDALEHYEEQIKTILLLPMQQKLGIDISDAAIRSAIEEHNRLCRVITAIGEYRKAQNPVITSYEFHVINVVSQVCPTYLILPYLEETLEELQSREPNPKKSYRVRVLLAGSEMDHPEFSRLFEECGAYICADRYCFGSKPGREPIEILEGESALHAVARHYLRTSQCPRFMPRRNVDGRREYIRKLAEEYHADGIVYESMKFCEFWGYERVLGTHIMERESNLPVMGIEREYALSSEGQLRTRIQAFVESIEIKKLNGGIN